VIATLRDGTLVQILGRRAIGNDSTWVEVALLDGRVGWIAADYLVPFRPFVAP
jgi:hypothetical protein